MRLQPPWERAGERAAARNGNLAISEQMRFLKERPSDYEGAAREIAAIVLRDYPEVMKKDVMAVTITYGYDIGIARSWRSQNVQHSPQEWQDILRK